MHKEQYNNPIHINWAQGMHMWFPSKNINQYLPVFSDMF